jgi:hypothetical protein
MHIYVYVFLSICACPSICVYPFLFVFVCLFMSTSLCVYHHCKSTLPMVLNLCMHVCAIHNALKFLFSISVELSLYANMFMFMCKFLRFYVHLCVCV